MKYVVFRLPESWLKKLDELVQEQGYLSRSDVLRYAVRNLLRKERKL